MFTKLYEYILSTENYSKYYYLVLRLNEETLNNLATKELKGLKGISDSIDIINAFFDVRDLMLVMKKEDVEKINEIEKIDYDDIDYLTKNNMEILRRIYDADDSYSIGSLLNQCVTKLYSYKYTKNKTHQLITLYRKFYALMPITRKTLERNIYDLKNIKTVKNYNDLLEKSYEIFKKFNISKEDLDIMLKYIILNFAAIFKKEGEVKIKNKIFKIPDNSVLFIKDEHPDSYTYEKK